MKVFGCIAYALVNIRSKLDEKSEKCIFIGCSPQSKAYRPYNPTSGKVIINRDVVFNKRAAWEWNGKKEESVIHIPVQLEGEHTTSLDSISLYPSSSSNSDSNNSSHGSSSNNSTPMSSHSPSSTSSSESPPNKFQSLEDIYASCSFSLLAAEPTCYEEPAKRPEWQNAMIELIQSIEKNQTWELVDLLEGSNVIGLKWIFKVKYNADRSAKRYKARLVAKGYSQKQSIDFEETFSAVAHFETVRTALALAAQLG